MRDYRGMVWRTLRGHLLNNNLSLVQQQGTALALHSLERHADIRVHHIHASILPRRFEPRPGRSKRSRMEHGKEHGTPDGNSMALGYYRPDCMGTYQYHSRVYRRHAHPLDSEEVQVPLPHHICIAPDSCDDCGDGVHHLRDLPVHERRQLPVHLLPVLAPEAQR